MNVLPGDLQHANELLECCDYCLARARVAQFGRDLDEAEKWAKEFLRCKRDLDKLIERKKDHDKLVRLVEEMQRNGVDVSIVARLTD